MDKFPRTLQRRELQALAKTLEISLGQLRRDDCGDWAVIGRRGRVYALAGSFQLVITGWHARGWNACKADLAAFAFLMQDGDREGAFTIYLRDLAPTEIEKIRKWLGLKKRRQLSDDALAELRLCGLALAASRNEQHAQTAA